MLIEALLWMLCVFFWIMAVGFAFFTIVIATVLIKEIGKWWRGRKWIKAGLKSQDDEPLAVAFLSAIVGTMGAACAVFVFLATAMWRNLS